MPNGVLGVVYEENKTKLSDTNRTLRVNSVFDEYVYWNYDKIPSDNDALIKALDWIEISKSVRKLPRCIINSTTRFNDFFSFSLQFQQPADPAKLSEFIENQKSSAAVKLKTEESNGIDEE